MVRDVLLKSFLNEGETIELLVHKHVAWVVGRFLKLTFFGVILPAALWFFFHQTLYFALLWGAIGLARIFYEWLDWYYDAWVATNMAIIQIEWEGFFRKSASRSEYHLVEGIGYEVNGFWATIFNYGTIVVEKETGSKLIFDGAAFPRKRAEKIIKTHESFVTQRNMRTHKSLKEMLSDLVHYHAKHGTKDL